MLNFPLCSVPLVHSQTSALAISLYHWALGARRWTVECYTRLVGIVGLHVEALLEEG